jgi:hypothetical protein
MSPVSLDCPFLISPFGILSDCCLTPTQQFFSYRWRERVNFQLDDDEVRFVLDQHAYFDFYSASSLQQLLVIFSWLNRISSVMVSVLASSVIDRGFES